MCGRGLNVQRRYDGTILGGGTTTVKEGPLAREAVDFAEDPAKLYCGVRNCCRNGMEGGCMPQEDYYEALGVNEKATQDEIKRAFRSLAKKYHPDKAGGDRFAENKFKDISRAYEVLNDPHKRTQYDRLRAAGAGRFGPQAFWGRGPGGGASGRSGGINGEDLNGLGDLGDIFTQMFGGQSAREAFSTGTRTRTRRKGEDVYHRLEVPFETAVKGGKVTIRLPATEECPACGGSGARAGSDVATCQECGGRGVVESMQGGFQFSRPCRRCLGKGKIIREPCRTCNGRGAVRRTKRISVAIPPGVVSGKKMRLAGKGEPSAYGGSPGDLFLEVEVQEHPHFRRRGTDILSSVTINFIQAILGVKVETQSVHGKVDVTVPPGTQPGTQLRLRGQGIALPLGTKGDHLVTINVELPRRVSSQQKKLLEEFAKLGKMDS